MTAPNRNSELKKNTTFIEFLFVSIIYNLSSAENQTSSINSVEITKQDATL